MLRHPLRRCALLAGFLLGPVVPASSQVLEMTTSVLDHPPSGPNQIVGNATCVALGKYSDDAIPDAAVLHGSTVHLAYAPDRRNAWSKVTGSFTSIARLPSYVSGTGRDAVIASTSAGLSVLVWDGTIGVRTLVATALPSTSAWANATDLQVVAYSTGLYEVVGLAASGASLVSMTWNPSTLQFTSPASFSVATGTTALAALQWDTDSDLEYATASSTGLVVHDHSGSTMTSIAHASADPILLAITDVGVPNRLAWMRAPSAGNEQLNVVLSGGTMEPAHVYYGADVTHMALIDLGEDSRKELWLTSNALTMGVGLRRDTAVTFLNWPANTAFAVDLNKAQSALQPPPDPAPGAGSGVYGGVNSPPVPGVMDLDGDGDDDIFLAGHPGQANRAMVCLGKVYNEERNILNAGRVKPWLTQYTFQITGALGGPQNGSFSFVLPSKPAAGPAAGATHVRYAVWSQAVGASSVTLVASMDIVLNQQIPPAPIINVSNVHLLGNGAKLHVEVSYFRLTGSLMTGAWPALLETLAVDLSNQSPQLFEDRVWLAQDEDGTSTSGSTARPPISPPTGGITP